MCRLNLFLLGHDIWETGDFQFGSRSQFTSSEFVTELQNHGIQISMDERGRCMDNAKMKRLWWALKYEDI